MRSNRLQDISTRRAMGRRVGLICALLWLATSTSASPVELYNDDAPKDTIIAQGEHYVDPGYWYPPINDDNDSWRMKLMMQREEVVPDERPDDAEIPWRGSLDAETSAAKRWVSALSTGGSSRTTTAAAQEKAQLQRKWKLKKGRGYPSLCYLKLCSFRRFPTTD